MRRFSVNLARRRFVNVRPVVRVSALLWVGALGLAAYDARQYWLSFSGHEDKTRRLEQVNAELRQEEAAIETGVAELRRMRLNEQNEQVAFLNLRIAERTFGWSVLFDRLADVLPRRVRLISLNPRRAEPERRRRAAEAESEVVLQIRGVAESDEPLLELVDALFADPAFREPQLRSESREDNGLLSFQLDVVYLPQVAAPPASTMQAAETAPPGVVSEPAPAVAANGGEAVATSDGTTGKPRPATTPNAETSATDPRSRPAVATARSEARMPGPQREQATREGAQQAPAPSAADGATPRREPAGASGVRDWRGATLPAIPSPVPRAGAPSGAPPAARRTPPPRPPQRRPTPLAPAASGARVPR